MPAKEGKRSGRKRRGRGEGSVYQRESDGLWVGSVSLGYDGAGKRRRVTVYGATKAEALAKLREAQSRSPVVDTAALTVGAYLATWLESSARPRLAPTTMQRYRELVDGRIVPHLGGIKLGKLAPLHVQSLYAALDKAGVSPRGQQMAGNVLGVALRDAVRLGLIPHNPARDVPKPKVHVEEVAALSAAQAKAFLEAAKADRLAALYVLAIDTGARQGELFGLLWSDVDLKAGTVRIARSLEELRGSIRLKELKTKASRRPVALTALGLQALKQHRGAMGREKLYRPDGPVFCDQQGGWLRKGNVLRRSYWPILDRAGLPRIKFHALRHTMATLLLSNGEAIKVVQERLGHSQATTTLNTYAHSVPGAQEQAAARLGKLLS